LERDTARPGNRADRSQRRPPGRWLLEELARAPMAAGPVDPLAWALASHDHAERYACQYPEFVLNTPPPAPSKLSDDYWRRATPVVDERLKLAGLRLATLLNEVLSLPIL
jgi:hypothetical protein